MKTYHRSFFVSVTALIVTVSFVTVAAAPIASKGMVGNISICIANCAQCHDIVGEVFDHRKCSRDCVQRRGTFIPDCTSPVAIREYLNLGKMIAER
ncbi:hypothetical protein BV898_04828 [Hypsibius exemplaris]|uniref:Eclosion hormone n=1 Tax=Hypsibius exemplaris TaxID=2072580 RepID=A0A1W0X0S6_HYPEX|nr:hypothetical protein BV898_04828 [Hypsibius exemplaris]